MPMAKNTICLWYDKDAETAARFYSETFPDSAVNAVHHAPGDYPSGKEGDVLTVEFTVAGIPCIGLNGGPEFKHNEAFSFSCGVRLAPTPATAIVMSPSSNSNGSKLPCAASIRAQIPCRWERRPPCGMSVAQRPSTNPAI